MNFELLKDNDNKYISNTYNRLNIDIEYAKGSYIYDKSGNKYLDMFSGIGVNNLGHCNDNIVKSLDRCKKRFIHLSNYYYNEYAVEYAKKLCSKTFAKKIFFTNSGTEANETAIKVSLKYGKRISKNKDTILSAYNSFHGRTMGGLSLTAQKKYQKNFNPLLSNIKYFKYNDIESLYNVVDETVCSVFIELIQGEGGIIEADNNFINELIKLSKKYNFLIIVDEIQTGLGRSGKLFAYEYYNLKPDVVTLAKSLGGGLPLGAVLLGNECFDIFEKSEHGSTFAPNPISCACGLSMFRQIINIEFIEEVNKKSIYLIKRLKDIKNNYPNLITKITGKGLMLGVKTNKCANLIKSNAFELNLLLNVTAINTIRLLPSLLISFEEIDIFIDKFYKCIEKTI